MSKKKLATLLLVSAVLVATTARAQTIIGTHEVVGFESPEGWAMAFMTAASLNLGQEPPRRTSLGDLQLSVELGSIPHLSEGQQSVGFGGFKHEDLNKSPVFGRARGSLGLPFDITAELSWTPPLELNGAKPDSLWGFALSRPLVGGADWGLGLRVFAQQGAVRADVSCSADVAAQPPATPKNPFSCLEPSDDRLEMDHYGAEVTLSLPGTILGLRPWVSLASTRMDPFVEVNALVLGAVDYSTVDSEGTTETVSGGLAWELSESWGLTLAGSYTPLDAQRPVDTGDLDDYWSIRLGLMWDF